MSILAVGSVAYDSVRTPFGEATEILGGSATYFSTAASFFTDVSLVACVGTDFKKQDLHFLESRGVNLDGLEFMEGKTFRWSGEYGYDLNDAQTLDTQLNVFADFNPKIPAHYRDKEFIFLGNIDPLLQRRVLSQVKRPKLVACDTMNYWIDGHFESLHETLKQVDMLVVNDAEIRQLTRESNLVKAARKLHTWGPQTLVVKQGEYGAIMFRREGDGEETIFSAPAYPLEDVFDPTGAGDSFAGGLVGYLSGVGRVDRESLRQAIVFGSVMASFNVERFSLERLKDLTFTEIQLRYREFGELVRFAQEIEVTG